MRSFRKASYLANRIKGGKNSIPVPCVKSCRRCVAEIRCRGVGRSEAVTVTTKLVVKGSFPTMRALSADGSEKKYSLVQREASGMAIAQLMTSATTVWMHRQFAAL